MKLGTWMSFSFACPTREHRVLLSGKNVHANPAEWYITALIAFCQ
uniref:Uncharacterized protein n=1 Tax=Anguilla anguilla TaxID=7936 RepID=A0A0E9UP88_ANGAN